MSGVLLNPYLTFQGDARDAMAFYQQVLGGTLNVQTFGEAGVPVSEGYQDKVMHAHLEADGIILMGSDGQEGATINPGDNVTLSLSGDAGQRERLTDVFTKLSEGGTTTLPLSQAPWGDLFGMFTDRYGVNWMVNVEQAGGGGA